MIDTPHLTESAEQIAAVIHLDISHGDDSGFRPGGGLVGVVRRRPAPQPQPGGLAHRAEPAVDLVTDLAFQIPGQTMPRSHRHRAIACVLHAPA